MADWRKKKSTPDSTPAIKKTQLADTGTSGTGSASVSWKGKKSEGNRGPFWLQGGRKRSIWRGSALFLSTLAIITFAAYLLHIITRKGENTPCIVITGWDFDAPWMPNGWAYEDSLHLAEFSGSQKRSLVSNVKYEGSQSHGDWNGILSEQLEKAVAGGPGGADWSWFKKYKSLVVYLSAQTLVRDNEPYLAFSNNSIVRFEEVLNSILTNQHHANSRLLIMLDTGRQIPDARISGLHHDNDFVTRAKAVVNAQSRASSAAVLFAADSRQLAWAAPELGGTIFGNFVVEGLMGAADAQPNGNLNRRISVMELANFVEHHVKEYASNTRAVDQQPTLVWCGGNQQDFDVCFCNPNELRPRSFKKLDEAKIRSLAQVWDGFDAWRRETLRTNPALVANVRELLSHADQLLWSGDGGIKAEYSMRASKNIERAVELMKAPLNRKLETTGTSRFYGIPPQPTFSKPGSTSAAATDSNANPPAPVTKATFADQARTWLAPPKSEKGDAVEPPVAQDMKEFVEFAWWWLKQDPGHWSSQQLAKLERLQPPLERISTMQLRLEDALLLQVFSDAQRMNQLWDSALKGANSQWPAHLQSLEAFEKQFNQVIEGDPRVLPAQRLQVDSLQANLRLQRDLLHARVAAENDFLNANFANYENALQVERKKWQTLDEFCDLLPLMINGTLRVGLENETQAAINDYSQLVSGRAKSAEQLAQKLEKLKQSYIGHVKSLLHDLAGGKLAPQPLRLIHQHLMHHPVDAAERSKLHQNLLAHYSSFDKINSQSSTEADANRGERATEELEQFISPELLKSFVLICGRDWEWQVFLKQMTGERENFDFGEDTSNLMDAARRTRLCTNWQQPSALQYDAAQLEEEAAWQNYLLWRVQSVTNDFWRTPLVGDIGQPFFEVCAQGVLREADALKHTSKSQRNSARELLDNRANLSRQWTSMLKNGKTEIDKSQKTVSVEWKTLDYPAGQASLMARMRRLGDWQYKMLQSVAVGDSQQKLNLALVECENGSLEIGFRGHLASLPFDFGKPMPQWILANEFLLDNRTTVVLDSEPQPTEIVFALDCSASFNDRENAIDFPTAKNALRTALDQIRNRPDLKVALVVFGHSRNFPEVKSGEINETWKQLRGTRFIGNRFDSDVVVLEELGDANDKKLKRIEDWLNDLSAFGATPLYHAIEKSKALLDASFANDSAKVVQRRVIVITDGVNNVVAKTESGAIAQGPQYQVLTNRTVDDLRRAFTSNAPAQLDVFHVGKDKDNLLDAVVKSTNGKYLNPAATTLADSLVDSLEPLEFSVVHKSGIKVEDMDTRRKFGSHVNLKKVSTGLAGDQFQMVVTEGKERHKVNAIDLIVYPGDKLEVKYNQKLDQFSFPFLGYDGLSSNLAHGLEAWRVRSRPDRLDIRFVLNQRDRTKQTVRPALVFLEAGEPGKPFFWTSEVVWEPGAPRPTCYATIQESLNLPEGKELSAKLWVCHRLPSPIFKVAMKDVNSVSKNRMIQVGTAKVTVDGNQREDLYRVQISVIPRAKERLIVHAPAASEVQQQFYPDGMVTYQFDYRNGKPDGEIEFYEPPTKNDPYWSGTEWIETQQK